jgi:peptide/nickel transport system permease protein
MHRGRTDDALPLPVAGMSVRWVHTIFTTIATFAQKKPLGVVGGMILLVMVSLAMMGPLIAPSDPYEVHVLYKYAAPGAIIEETGERFWLGADQLGRDTLSRLIYGARVSLYVSLVSVSIGVTIGALIGIVSAYFGGTLDLLVQRIVDTVMAFPAIILALAIVAIAGASLRNVILALIVLLMPAAARVVRSQALAVKEMDYVLAARAAGSGSWRIIFHHMLPNCTAPYIVFATANLGYAVVVEAALSFLGVGTPPDVPSWGGMLSITGQKYIEVSPWLVVFPSIAVSIAVFGFNLLGDALRDVLDPKLKGEQSLFFKMEKTGHAREEWEDRHDETTREC